MRGAPWPEKGGYADGVFDDRLPDYVRFYVGQSSRLRVRISAEHSAKILNGNVKALHYFVLARGRGHRSARFLRLWTCPPGPSQTEPENRESEGATQSRFELTQNLLKMTFCRAFESLPASILTQFFGPAAYSNVGLNNLPPLFQGGKFPSFKRARYLECHRASPDPDISAFVDIRKAQKAQERNAKCQSMTYLRGDYRQAIYNLVEETGLSAASLSCFTSPADGAQWTPQIESELRALETEMRNDLCQESRSFSAPFGTPRAKLGIVLCSESTGIKQDGHEIQPLQGLRLDEKNALIWTSSFERMGSGPSGNAANLDLRRRIASMNHSIIMRTGVRVVILCGLKAEQDILSAFQDQLSGPYELFLRNYAHSIWLMTSGKDVLKILIASPEPLVLSVFRNVTQARRLRDVFGLASTLTGDRIKHNFWENACFHAALFAQVRREKEGAKPLTAASLGVVFRDWLHYRGFVDEADVEELERKSENLTVALLQIRSILAGRSRDFTSIDDSNHTRYKGKYDPVAFGEVARFFERVYSRRQVVIQEFKKVRSDDCLQEKQQQEDDEDTEDAQIDNDVVDIDSPIIKLVEQLDSDGHVSEQEDEKEHDPDGYDEARPIQSPRTGGGTGRALFHETPDSRSRLDAMLTEEGEHIRATQTATRGTYSLSTTHALVKFTPIPDVGVKFCDRPLFAVRAGLAKAGLMHEHRVLGNNTQYNSSDPCLRLALQYRLLDNDDRRGPSSIWKWATVREAKKASAEVERISKANTLVDLLQGKSAADLLGIHRRSLLRWENARKKRKADVLDLNST